MRVLVGEYHLAHNRVQRLDIRQRQEIGGQTQRRLADQIEAVSETWAMAHKGSFGIALSNNRGPHPNYLLLSGQRLDSRYRQYRRHRSNNPFGIQWQRYWSDAPYPELVKTVPHVAFEVEELESAVAGHKVLIPSNSPSPGVVVAIIEVNGAPVELMQIDRSIPDQDTDS